MGSHMLCVLSQPTWSCFFKDTKQPEQTIFSLANQILNPQYTIYNKKESVWWKAIPLNEIGKQGKL